MAVGRESLLMFGTGAIGRLLCPPISELIVVERLSWDAASVFSYRA